MVNWQMCFYLNKVARLQWFLIESKVDIISLWQYVWLQ